MGLKFLFGRAGQGKTNWCLEQVCNGLRPSPIGTPLILLVPEQATFQIEQALAKGSEEKGFVRAHVLSFQRLAHEIFLETGGASRSHISELGKRMVLRRILEEKKTVLKTFRKAAERQGFTEKLAVALTELKMYRVTPWDLQGSANYLEGQLGTNPLASKLLDLSELYAAWEGFLENRYTDTEDYLNLLADRIPNSAFLQEACIWVDGFKGFTPQEYFVLEQLIKRAHVCITLCLDAEHPEQSSEETAVFYPVWQTWQRLLKIAAENAIDISNNPLLEKSLPRFAHSPALQHLEREFFRYPAPIYPSASQELQVVNAVNPRAEIEGVARKIRQLCRDKQFRYRDIAIILRDMESYGDHIATIFADYDIPYFIDQKRGILHHPLTELIRSALEIVSENWGYDAVFRYLKTDLTGIGRQDIDILENYVLAHGIRGTRWIDGIAWEYRLRYTLEEDTDASERETGLLSTVNGTRNLLIEPLEEFLNALQGSVTVRTITSALLNLLLKLNVPETLETWSEDTTKRGKLVVAKEHAQIWGSIMELFDQMVDTLGETILTIAEYTRVLEDGLESIKLGLIPPGIDQVLVASLDRSRSPNVRAAFILGVNDGIYPSRISDNDIFSALDRERLKEIGLELAPGRDGRIIEEQFFIYTALTRASEFLWISYILADNEGKGATPSFIIRRIKEMFPAMQEIPLTVQPNGSDDLEFISHPQRSLGHLAGKLREGKAGTQIDAIWWDVYQWAYTQETCQDQLKRIVAGLYHRNQDAKVPEHLLGSLYGNPMRVSVSKIEKFRSCPFSHFAAFALRLQERHIHQLEAPSLGQLFHATLKKVGDTLLIEGRSWGDLSRNECSNKVSEAIEEIVPRLQSEILLSSARYKYLVGKIRRTVERSALTLAEHDRRGSFRPVGLELSFGPRGELPPIRLQLADGRIIEVEGRIDRIDAAQTDNGIYLRVIDYKMGDERLDLSEVYYGLRLQLLTYLHVSIAHASRLVNEDANPGGMLYFRIQDPLISCQQPLDGHELEKEILKAMKTKGFILGDPKIAALMDGSINKDDVRTSELIPVGLLKNGDFDSKSSILTPDQFTLLQQHVETMVAKSGGDILQGLVDIKPHCMSRHIPCTYCKYRSVCQFDELLEDNLYQVLHKLTPDLIWKKLAAPEQEETP
jgi:ATP-dependent helicase/nuclease subunit B